MTRDHKAIVKQQYLGIRGMALYLVQLPLWLSIPINLIFFKPLNILSAGVASALLCYAAYLTQRHYRSRRDNYVKTGKDHADEDNRLYALGFTALAAAVLAFTARPQPLFGLINALLAAGGYYLSYLYSDTPTADVRPPPLTTAKPPSASSFARLKAILQYLLFSSNLAEPKNVTLGFL